MSSEQSVDKFGRKKTQQRIIIREKIGVGFKLTDDGNYDIQNKRLVNIGEPIKPADCATVRYIDSVNRETKGVILKAVQESVITSFGNVKTVMSTIQEQVKELKTTVGLTRGKLQEQIKQLELEKCNIRDVEGVQNSINQNTEILSRIIQGLEKRIEKIEK